VIRNLFSALDSMLKSIMTEPFVLLKYFYVLRGCRWYVLSGSHVTNISFFFKGLAWVSN